MTEQCLLSPTRNPNLDRARIEHYLKVRSAFNLPFSLPSSRSNLLHHVVSPTRNVADAEPQPRPQTQPRPRRHRALPQGTDGLSAFQPLSTSFSQCIIPTRAASASCSD